ncbi:MAG: DUF7064 domain-containing protein [Sporichthyaceae bacterium]
MITPQDARLHTPSSPTPAWAETNYWGFHVPGTDYFVNIYALFRTNLGVVQTMVAINSRRAGAVWEGDYWDFQAHVEIPDGFDMLDYRLDSGLAVKAIEPNVRYEVSFDDGEGTSIRFDYRALMAPFDIHDPEMDPMAGEAWGDAYNGHFDQTGVFTGELTLRGQRMPFECVSTWDHSWGIRPERHRSSLSWLHAHFGEDLAIHAMLAYDPADRAGTMTLTHGYVLEDGAVYGLTGGTGSTSHDGWYPAGKDLTLTDGRGRQWNLRGVGRTAFPLQAWPDIVFFQALMDWTVDGGRAGAGETMDFYAVADLTDEQAKRGQGPW